MAKKLSKSDSVADYNANLQPAPKTRVRRDHSNDFKFFVLHMLPGMSVVAVRRGTKLTGVYAVSETDLTKLSTIPEKSMTWINADNVIKSRGGIKPVSTLISADLKTAEAVKLVATLVFIAQPDDKRFMAIENETRTPVPEISVEAQIAASR